VGLCEYCHEPLTGVVVRHHLRNRADGGTNADWNLVPRHKRCEEYCHRHFRHGNPAEGVKGDEQKRRERSVKPRKKLGRRRVSKLQKKKPHIT
jgi:hypothetical protein